MHAYLFLAIFVAFYALILASDHSSAFARHFTSWFIDRNLNRQPDAVIGGHDDPYLLRWWLIPRNPVFNVYLHLFLRSDDDRALHDHPWLFNLSVLLWGEYAEHTSRRGVERVTRRQAGDFKLRVGRAPHRLELLPAEDLTEAQIDNPGPLPCWTLFITGPRVREWGFDCPHGWIHWKKFTAADDPGAIGKGCDA